MVDGEGPANFLEGGLGVDGYNFLQLPSGRKTKFSTFFSQLFFYFKQILIIQLPFQFFGDVTL